jgi:small-conductance mechanosensitive channel
MNFETLQQHWQQQKTCSQFKVDATLVLQEVRRNQRSFQAMIFWRDFRETAAALFATIFFAARGRDWTDWLLAVAAAGVGLYLLVDRLRQRKQRPRASEDLRLYVQHSLDEVRHQSWLLRNVLWWYLLPLMVPVLISIAVQADAVRQGVRQSLVIVLVTWLIYKLNQHAVRTQIVPREQELERLLAGISEPGDEDVLSHSSDKVLDEK